MVKREENASRQQAGKLFVVGTTAQGVVVSAVPMAGHAAPVQRQHVVPIPTVSVAVESVVSIHRDVAEAPVVVRALSAVNLGVHA
jgi:hypothetical protein